MASTDPPLRITYLVTSSVLAGAERQVHDLALAFHRRGWEVTAVSMVPIGPGFVDLPDLGVPASSLEMARGIPDPRAAWRFREHLRRTQPDIVHAHMFHANFLARLTRMVTRIPVLVSTIHNQLEHGQRYRLYRLTDRLTDLTTVVGRQALTAALDHGAGPEDRLRFVPNGIDVARYEGDPDTRRRTRERLGLADRFMWFAAGRFTGAKDYPNMVSAFKRLRDMRPDAVLMVAGIGELEQEVAAMVEREGLGGSMVLLGLRSDVPDLMQAADGFVLSSAHEGLPMVLLEAAASSLPIVTTAVGGSDDVVLDGVSGSIVPTRDPAALAAAMARIMSLDALERDAMGTAARAHVAEHFDLEAVASTWERIYRDLVHRHRRRLTRERATELGEDA